jgi:hypothetical protein
MTRIHLAVVSVYTLASVISVGFDTVNFWGCNMTVRSSAVFIAVLLLQSPHGYRPAGIPLSSRFSIEAPESSAYGVGDALLATREQGAGE